MKWFEEERPMTPEEQAIYAGYVERAREHRKEHPLTVQHRVDIGIAEVCGLIWACFSGPWWWYAVASVVGFAIGWVVV